MSMKSSRLTLFVLGILLFAFLTQATRPVPADPQATTQPPLVAAEEQTEAAVESCGDDDCMMRRTLEAHLDYIYTQEKKH
ncbi:hypothetical protein Taro_037377 [Colocasia esculenta]|uniref:Phytosulfokine n=1 Tax=Colocasia esculenta TaxID=4460 RepID=A0A843WAZ0_COLES|nr:hypothetical protein [Colocasia esculenta]